MKSPWEAVASPDQKPSRLPEGDLQALARRCIEEARAAIAEAQKPFQTPVSHETWKKRIGP